MVETQAVNERRAADLRLRAGRPEDAEDCGSICYGAFRAISDEHNFPPDFPSPEVAGGLLASMLSREDVYSVVAEADGRVVGSNFLWENGTIAGVGPITIDPGAQNAAVGRRLMEDVLRRAEERNIAGVRLVQAAYHGRSLSLYTKLGFDAREPLSNLQGPAIGERIPGYAVRAAKEGTSVLATRCPSESTATTGGRSCSRRSGRGVRTWSSTTGASPATRRG